MCTWSVQEKEAYLFKCARSEYRQRDEVVRTSDLFHFIDSFRYRYHVTVVSAIFQVGGPQNVWVACVECVCFGGVYSGQWENARPGLIACTYNQQVTPIGKRWLKLIKEAWGRTENPFFVHMSASCMNRASTIFRRAPGTCEKNPKRWKRSVKNHCFFVVH